MLVIKQRKFQDYIVFFKLGLHIIWGPSKPHKELWKMDRHATVNFDLQFMSAVIVLALM